MSIYHLHAKVVQRSKGKNIIAASAYRRAAKLRDEKEGKYFDFRAKKDVLYSEIAVPENAPSWAQDLVELHQYEPSQAAEQLWNRSNIAEKRRDAQLAREIEFALPIELNEAQSIHLARAFIRDQFVLRGMIADWSLHWYKGNPHVHVLLTMRALNEEGFGRRVLEWNSKSLLQTWREKWAEYANFHLHLHQHAVRIDHRSYEAQGIELVPGIHEGFAAREMVKRGIEIDRLNDADQVRKSNFARLSEKAEILFRRLSSFTEIFTDQQIADELSRYLPNQGSTVVLQAEQSIGIESILQAISRHESVFSEKELVRVLKNHFPEYANELAKILLAIKNSPEVIALGLGTDGKERFTTRTLFEAENSIQQLADELKLRFHVSISEIKQNALLAHYQEKANKILTDEQQSAVLHFLKSTAIACMVGRAGTGKSFCLGAAKSMWEAQGLKVHGIALSGIAADGLSKEVGIPSMTIESFRYRIANQLLSLNPLDVVIMDEAGMTDSLSMLAILKIVQQANAKLVLVGDPGQLQPVGPGATFRALVERLGFVEIQQVYRQSISWQREATVNFSTGEIAKGLAAYQKENCLFMEADPDLAMKKLVMDWKQLVQNQNHLSQILVIAHRNQDVDALNLLLRAERVQAGDILSGYKVQTVRGEISIAPGDRILFLKNKRALGVSNGRFATVEFVDFIQSNQVNYFTVKLDGSDKIITINPYQYNHFTYGYAATIHKVQGITIDHSLVYAGGKGWNRHLTYVAMSRHRHSCLLYADRETHAHHALFIRRLSRLGLKDSVLDFPLAFAERRGIDAQNTEQRLTAHLAKKLASWKKQIIDKIAQWVSVDKNVEQEISQAHVQPSPDAVKRHQTNISHKKIIQNKFSVSTYPRIDIKRLRADLNARAEQVATHYLGQPKIKQGHVWRYGNNKGSLVVTIQGAKQGLWRDFQLDKGGDMLGLIQDTLETSDFKAVLQEAARFLGGDSLYRTSLPVKSSISVSQIKKNDLDEYTQQRIQKAQAIVQGTQSINGTLAERYLREHRGILGALEEKTLRYHPNLRNWMTRSNHPALVIVARDEADEVCGIQAIFLDASTGKKAIQLGHHVKLSRGVIGEGSIIHTGTPEGKIALAEGPETALSIAEANPDWNVYVTFGIGNFSKVRLPDHAKSVLICADNDGQDSNTQKSLAKSAKKLAERGLDVWVAEPQKPEQQAKWDFNDALRAGGATQVKNDLDEAKLYQKGISTENLTSDLKNTLSVLGEATSAIEIPATIDQTVSIPEVTHESLNTLLMRYVDMELEQTRLVNALHSARLQNPQAGKMASLEALDHANKIQAFAEQAIEHPEIKTILEARQNIKPSHITDCGGFVGIRERLQRGEWLEEDIHVLVGKLRSKAMNESRMQMRDRSRSERLK